MWVASMILLNSPTLMTVIHIIILRVEKTTTQYLSWLYIYCHKEACCCFSQSTLTIVSVQIKLLASRKLYHALMGLQFQCIVCKCIYCINVCISLMSNKATSYTYQNTSAILFTNVIDRKRSQLF